MKTDTDASVFNKIGELVAEEQRLYKKGEPSDADIEKLRGIGVQLDQCWDLLRQRRALREYGKDPSEAQLRDARIVEKYQG
ncbi:DUF2630 family protein [Taklimakanibacter deserti]|uniref:DUF2630 family protein n=1 Tax=Taklimakanibacter deserti TaxID=2267839 RepID=UPI000E64BF69